MVVLKELTFNGFYFGRGLESDFNSLYFGRECLKELIFNSFYFGRECGGKN